MYNYPGNSVDAPSLCSRECAPTSFQFLNILANYNDAFNEIAELRATEI